MAPNLRASLQPQAFVVPKTTTLEQVFVATKTLTAAWPSSTPLRLPAPVGWVGRQIIVDTGHRTTHNRRLVCAIWLGQSATGEVGCMVSLERLPQFKSPTQPFMRGWKSAKFLARLASRLNVQLNSLPRP